MKEISTIIIEDSTITIEESTIIIEFNSLSGIYQKSRWKISKGYDT